MEKQFKDFKFEDFHTYNLSTQKSKATGGRVHVTSFRVKEWPAGVERSCVNKFTDVKVSDLV